MNIKSISQVAILVALNVILNMFVVPVNNLIEISFAYIPIAISGYLLGPVLSIVVGIIGDLLGFMIRPSGFFFVGFTISAAVEGLIYGQFLYKKPITRKRIVLVTVIETIIVSVVLTPLWLRIMYGTDIFSAIRIIKSLIMIPIKTILTYSSINTIISIKRIDVSI